MTKGEQLYKRIQYDGKIVIEEASANVIQLFEADFFRVNIKSPNSINKIYELIGQGHYKKLKAWLDVLEYSNSAELQYLIRNFGFSYMLPNAEEMYARALKFPSLNGFNIKPNNYILDTSAGRITVMPLQFAKDSIISEFASKYQCMALCHEATYEFIKQNPSYQGITSLIENQFGERQYHSYVLGNEGYIDFANNVLWNPAEFDVLMQPEELNTVTGNEIEVRLCELGNDDLPDNYSKILRLAVSEQLKKKR